MPTSLNAVTPLGKCSGCVEDPERTSQLQTLATARKQVVSMVLDVDHGVGDASVQRGQHLVGHRARVRDHLPLTHVSERHLQGAAIQLLPVTRSTMERIPSSMARNRKRSSRRESAPQETEFYVTVAHERGSACDSCAQPRPVLIETEDGQWWCEVCTGQVDGDELWKAAVITLMGGDSI